MTNSLLFKGDSPVIERLDTVTLYGAVPLDSGEYVPVSWRGTGGVRLALEMVEPRFADEWLDLLPPESRDAEKPILEPAGNEPGLVH